MVVAHRVSSPTLGNKLFHVGHKALVGHQVLNVQVHSLVAWVGWYVDTLGVGVLQAQALVHGKPVLQAQHA